MKTLRVYNYEILNFDAEPLVFSANGFTKITNLQLTQALRRIEERHAKYITQDELTRILTEENLDPQPVMAFLEKASIIGDTAEAPYFEKIIICHDFDLSGDLKKHLEKRFHGKLEIKNLSRYKPHHTGAPTLFVLACLKLRPVSIRSMYNEVLALNPESGASIGFISANHFHLTEAYLPSIGNPCAFCTLDRIAHYETLRTSQHHWSKVWAFCRNNQIDLPKAEIDELQLSLVFGSIVSFASKFLTAPKGKSTQDQILLSKTINLDTGAITEDISVHWPLCQCLEFK